MEELFYSDGESRDEDLHDADEDEDDAPLAPHFIVDVVHNIEAELIIEHNNQMDEACRVLTANGPEATSIQVGFNDEKLYLVSQDDVNRLCTSLLASSCTLAVSIAGLQVGVDLLPLATLLSRETCTLEEIYFEECAISNFAPIVPALNANKSLKRLIFETAVDEPCVIAVARALHDNTTLRLLIFEYGVRDSGAIAFAHMLRVNATLKSLRFNSDRRVPVSQAAIELIAASVEQNVIITGVKVPHHPNREVEKRIKAVCRHNRFGRRLLRSVDVRPGLWPHLFARALPREETYTAQVDTELDMLYYLLKEKGAELLLQRQTLPPLQGTVRKRCDYI